MNKYKKKQIYIFINIKKNKKIKKILKKTQKKKKFNSQKKKKFKPLNSI